MVDGSRTSFGGTKRFKILSHLGSGGMGDVYAVYDRKQGAKVALKALRSQSSSELLSLRDDFDALKKLRHPNLASLGEILEEDGQWFYTMELVKGVDLISYVRKSPDGFDERRLRNTLVQLARGLMVLHGAGRVHRDIKPSNILVTAHGRVVLLDFGLVVQQDLDRQRIDDPHPVGTAAYMAPEQAVGVNVGAESDWYSVGVILFQALTGKLPYSGPSLRVMFAKQDVEPPRPRDVDPQLPRDLDALCWKLMQYEPMARPDAEKVLRHLGAEQSQQVYDGTSTFTRSRYFAGREEELAALFEAQDRARRGTPVCVQMFGATGLGKTELLSSFVHQLLAQDRQTIVLSGRCHERQSVPFAAFDGVVDQLSLLLRDRIEQQELAAAIKNVGPLTRVFPVLGRVEGLGMTPRSRRRVEDLQELKSSAFRALWELLAWLADRFPVVLIIDDLQWADADSLQLLRALLQTDRTPSICLVASLSTPVPGEVISTLERVAVTFPDAVRRLDIGPLSANEAIELAARLLGGDSKSVEAAHKDLALAARIGRDSAGHPLFIHEMAQHVQTVGELPKIARLRLKSTLLSRLEALEPPLRALAELAAVAGGPIRLEPAAHAAGIQPSAVVRQVAKLRLAAMLRSSGARLDDTLESYHPQVREVILERLSVDEMQHWHSRLARVLEESELPDPEQLVRHIEGAGDAAAADGKKIAMYATEAADQAAERLAFNRAAILYEKALQFLPAAEPAGIDPQRRELMVHLGDALANAGKGSHAARAYLKAVKGSMTAEALELQRRAADHLIRSGHISEGLAVTEQLLEGLGMTMPRTPFGAAFSHLRRRLFIRLRGIGFKNREEGQLSAERLSRLDIIHSVAISMAVADHIRGADFSTRFVLSALAVGELRRVLVALSMEANFVAASGRTHSRYMRRLISTSERLLEQVNDPLARFYLEGIKAFGAFMAGAWAEAREHAEQAELILVEHGTGGTPHERAYSRFVILWSLFYLGELEELTRRRLKMIEEAQDQGDRYALTGMVLGRPNLAALNQLGPERARKEVTEIIDGWRVEGYHLQHYYALVADTHIDLYEGQGDRAHERVGRAWPSLKRSMLLMLPSVRDESQHLRARTALATALGASPARQTALLALAQRDAQSLARRGFAWTSALAKLLQAGVAVQRGETDQAVSQLQLAVKALDEAQMRLYAAAARRRLGALMGGDAGAAHLDAGDAFMVQQRVTDRRRMTALLAPGFED